MSGGWVRAKPLGYRSRTEVPSVHTTSRGGCQYLFSEWRVGVLPNAGVECWGRMLGPKGLGPRGCGIPRLAYRYVAMLCSVHLCPAGLLTSPRPPAWGCLSFWGIFKKKKFKKLKKRPRRMSLEEEKQAGRKRDVRGRGREICTEHNMPICLYANGASPQLPAFARRARGGV